jgi:2-amino-4-hydroxy-6-hydroxymethyldihydropteridine diphosphokinase
MKMKIVYLGIGTNLGEREFNLREALNRIELQIGLLTASSPVYETEPWGFDSDDKFLNMVVRVRTSLSPQALLKETGLIEASLGRIRGENQYASRIIDIDILFYDDLIIDEVNLKIPHPGIAERRFVLVPLNEIAPDLVHPLLKNTVSSLLESCPDSSQVLSKGPLAIKQP